MYLIEAWNIRVEEILEGGVGGGGIIEPSWHISHLYHSRKCLHPATLSA